MRVEGAFPVTMLPGDGVGPELMHAVKEVFKVNSPGRGMGGGSGYRDGWVVGKFRPDPALCLGLSLKAAAVPVEFKEHHLSEVQNMASEEKLEQVLSSMKENKVAIIGLYGTLSFKSSVHKAPLSAVCIYQFSRLASTDI